MTELSARLRYLRTQSFDRSAVVRRSVQRIVAQSRVGGPAPDPATAHRVFVNSVPKAGTHLLAVALKAIPGIRDSGVFLSHLAHDGSQRCLVDSLETLERVRSGYFVSGHMPWASGDEALLESLGYRTVLLVRDPRDVLLSQIDHAVERPVNRYHRTLIELPDLAARVAFMLNGGRLVDSESHAPAFDAYVRSYLRWNSELVVRFEDLVGSRAGADPEVQARTIRTVAAHFLVELDDEEVEKIAHVMSSSHTPTLRKGQIDRWRSEFTQGMRVMADESLADLIDQLGYQR